MKEAQIIEKNINIDVRLVNNQKRLEQNLRSFGVDVKPKYTISRPLDSKLKCSFYNQ